MPLLVDLGSGRQAMEVPNYVHIDKWAGDHIEYVWDLERGLPREVDGFGFIVKDAIPFIDGDKVGNKFVDKRVFADSTVDEFRAHHVLEHICRLIPLMDELWDALKTEGVLRVYVPNGHHVRAAWSDPTHVRAFTPETFDYFTHETLAAYPYTSKEWRILKREVRGTPPDDLWEIYCEMQPVK